MRVLRSLMVFAGVVMLFGVTMSFASADTAVRSVLDRTAPSAGLNNICQGSSCVPAVVGGVISIVLGLFGVALIAYILYGGYLWMTAGGEGDQVEDAQKIIRNAVIGVAIIGFSYTLSGTVLGLVNDIFSPPAPPPADEAAPTTPTAERPTTPTATPPAVVDPFRSGCQRTTCTSECVARDCERLEGTRRFTCETTCSNTCNTRCSSFPPPAGTTGAGGTRTRCDTTAATTCTNTCITSDCDRSLPATFETCRNRCQRTCNNRHCPLPVSETCTPLADYRRCLENCTADIDRRAGLGEYRTAEARTEALQVCNGDCSFLYCR